VRQGERVYEALRAEILDWRLPPGTVLGEVDLSQRLGVSRTPVREALPRLAREGLVRLTPGRGAVVSEVSMTSIAKLFQMREALETYAARLAARRGDVALFGQLCAEFEQARQQQVGGDHEEEQYAAYYALIQRFDAAIEDAADNQYLSTALDELHAHLARLRRLAQQSSERMLQSVDEHLSICRAICDRDEILAAQATAVHIHNSLRHILTVLVEDLTGSALAGADNSALSSA
jgi:GntR family transcriptional regulator, rspAB operon transcriptional repressor